MGAFQREPGSHIVTAFQQVFNIPFEAVLPSMNRGRELAAGFPVLRPMIIRILFFLFLSSLTVWAKPGDNLRKGTVLPEIVEQNQLGESTNLQDLKGPKGILLVVFRSADW
jgi:hypothetical protein